MKFEVIFLDWIELLNQYECETMQRIVSSGKCVRPPSFQVMAIDESFVLNIINKRSLLEDGLLENKEPLGSSRWRSQTGKSGCNFTMHYHFNWNIRRFPILWSQVETGLKCSLWVMMNLNSWVTGLFKKAFLALLLLNSPAQVVCYQGYVFNILVTNLMLKKWSWEFH